VTPDGTLNVPAEISQALGLQPGDVVTFTTMPDRTAFMAPRNRSLTSARSVITPPEATGPVAVEDMALGEWRIIKFGLLKAELTVPDDFDAPLPDDLLNKFEGH
jgi:bifunctional DNA-binding transcriptional regulator/antitoxin component of YhaV-PrlF toxin-antitoxin module